MDKIEKFLKLLDKKTRQKVKDLLLDICANRLGKLRPKKLKGLDKLYSIRDGKIRIIFKKQDNKNIPESDDYRKNVYKDLK